MNPFDNENPLAPLYALVCGCLAIWGITDSACANSDKQVCKVWQQANIEIVQTIEAKLQGGE